MSLRYVYTANGQFKENDQVKIDYTLNDSKLSSIEPVQSSLNVEQFTEQVTCGSGNRVCKCGAGLVPSCFGSRCVCKASN
jgi:hypothetical protein